MTASVVTDVDTEALSLIADRMAVLHGEVCGALENMRAGELTLEEWSLFHHELDLTVARLASDINTERVRVHFARVRAEQLARAARLDAAEPVFSLDPVDSVVTLQVVGGVL